MAEQLFANNATTTIRGSLSTSATTIFVNDSTGFPSPTGGDWFVATLDGGGNYFEIVKVTAVNGIAWTVERAQEGTTAKLWQPGSRIECRVTAGSLEGLRSSNYINVKTFGAVGNGVVDDSIAIQAAMDVASVITKKLYFPPGTYKTTQGIVHRHGVEVFGAGMDSTTVINQATTLNFAFATCWHAGTYGPGNSSQGTPKHQPGFQFNAAVLGANSVTLTVAANAANYAVGDLVSIEGSTLNANTLNTPNEMFIVTAVNVGTGVVTFDAPLKSAYPTGAATLMLRKLNTGIPSTTSMVAMIPGLTAYALDTASLSDITIQSTNSGFTAVNLSTFNCIFTRVRAIGYNAFAGNPCARTTFLDCEGLHTNTPFEVAYLSHDTIVQRSRFVKTSPSTNPSAGAGVWVNNGEGAKYITFVDVDVVDDDPANTGLHPAVEINGEGNKWIRGTVYCTRPVDSIQCGSRTLVEGTVILKSGGHGIVPGGTDAIIDDNKVYNTPVGKNAIFIPPAAVGTLIIGNVLGQGTRAAADSVNDTATARNNTKSNNRTFYTKDRSFTTFPNTLTGTTTETTRQTLSYAAGTLDLGHMFDIDYSGEATGGSNKTIRIKLDGVTEITLPTITTGAWNLRGRIGISQGSQTWFYSLFADIGGVTTPLVGTFNNNFATSTSLSLTQQLANAGDSLITYLCEFKFISENATLS